MFNSHVHMFLVAVLNDVSVQAQRIQPRAVVKAQLVWFAAAKVLLHG